MSFRFKNKKILFQRIFLFLILEFSLLLRVQSEDSLLVRSRILGDQFLPIVNSSFDPQAFIDSEDELSFATDCSASNTNNKITNNFALDAEWYVCNLRSEYRFNKSLKTQLDLPFINSGGGIFDSWISGWHDFWGMPNGNRGNTRDNEFTLSGSRGFNWNSEGLGVLDPKLYTEYELLSVSKDAKINVTNGLLIPLNLSEYSFSKPSINLGTNYDRLRPDDRFTLGVDLSASLQDELEGLSYENLVYRLYFSYLYKLFDRLTFVSNSSLQSSYLGDVEGFPSASWYVDLGFRTDYILNRSIELLVRENLYASKGTVDVSIIISVIKF